MGGMWLGLPLWLHLTFDLGVAIHVTIIQFEIQLSTLTFYFQIITFQFPTRTWNWKFVQIVL